MTTQMIILNGGSSSGKSGIVRCLQAELPDQWLTFGVDSLIDAMPARMQTSEGGLDISADGAVAVGADFRALEQAWARGIVAMARAGARIIVDDVFLGGAASQQRWQKLFDDQYGRSDHDGHDRRSDHDGPLGVLWVGVRCDPTAAAAREIARGDRVRGMAVAQADLVHRGVHYDLEVDTTHTESLTCARAIAAHVRRPT
ncbi:chloramphenicol phosphotransferase CPT [Streptomyces akebiae]|uniref:Chloramphenicol phosphotransferase CPT n=1 Tax=Streptomyces akebiae TaxID=2865673 RepID=A0ABX8XVJ3_9ACTN|nr:chloramphenicol phosphotransferase CPT [Streptomyces akebiae]QYX79367.1 chloramphenicol phosphotransferase CPT [Streptomyces akebiae]